MGAMKVDDVKKVLKVAEKAPVSFVFFLVGKAEQNVLLLDKRKAGKQLFDGHKKDFKALKGAAYGTLTKDKVTLVLDVEKNMPGLVKQVLATLKANKLIDYKVESMQPDEEEADEDGPTQAASDEAPASQAALSPEDEVKALSATVKDLASRFSKEGKQLKAAYDAVAKALKKGDVVALGKGLTLLRRMIAALQARDGGGEKLDGNALYQSAARQWLQTRRTVDSELRKLQGAIAREYEAEAIKDEVLAGIRKLDRVMDVLDESLARKLGEVVGAKTMDERRKAAGEAGGIVMKYKQFVDGEPLMAMLDDNPFEKVQVRALIESALTDIVGNMRQAMATL